MCTNVACYRHGCLDNVGSKKRDNLEQSRSKCIFLLAQQLSDICKLYFK